jgi:hypothetical protein
MTLALSFKNRKSLCDALFKSISARRYFEIPAGEREIPGPGWLGPFSHDDFNLQRIAC